jgi:hypothetical protein
VAPILHVASVLAYRVIGMLKKSRVSVERVSLTSYQECPSYLSHPSQPADELGISMLVTKISKDNILFSISQLLSSTELEPRPRIVLTR